MHERSPVWSPDGKEVAWLSDASGEYQLMVGDPLGLKEPRVVTLPSKAFFSEPVWSPDGARLLLEDSQRNLWVLELASGRASKIDTDTYDDPGRLFEAVWSSDSKWIAYSKSLASHMRAIFVHSLAEGRSHQLTDGLSDAVSPVFDAGGRYLYFLASTDYGLRNGWLDMSQLDHPVTRAIYLVVLRAGDPSPLLPELGEEPGVLPAAMVAGGDAQRDTTSAVSIDLDGIDQSGCSAARADSGQIVPEHGNGFVHSIFSVQKDFVGRHDSRPCAGEGIRK